MSVSWAVLFFAVILSLSMICVKSFDEDKSIYKWSPLTFSGGLSRPRNTYPWKQSSSCGRSKAPCSLVHSLVSDGGWKCCEGLACHRVGRYGICLRPSWKTNVYHPIY